MSQDPARKACTLSDSPHEERHKRLPPLGSRTLPPIQSAKSFEGAQNGPSNGITTQNGAVQQPLQPSSSSDQRSSRPIGVKNLLNPASNGEPTNGHNRHRNGEHPDTQSGNSPNTTAHRAATPSLPAPTITARSPINVSLPSITPPSMNMLPHSLGRSPSIFAPSPVMVNTPSGTMDVKQSPFVLPRDHAAPGGHIPHGLPEMNRVPSMSGDAYAFGVQPTRSPSGRRRSSQDSSRYDHMQRLVSSTSSAANGSHPSASLSDSPSTQYSSYSQVSRQTPPAQLAASTGQPQSFFTPFSAGGPASTVAQMAFEVPASGSAAGGSTYQMMTLDTENGPIQVPVDVQAASKVADEKRKRNATASHRFRQRRKEKERETSQNISKLEAQIRDMEEEREFYRGERDYFRNLASRVPGQVHLLPRPVSPRQRRHASMNGAMGFGNVQFQSPENGNRDGGRNTKRRTSSYVPPSGPPPQPGAVPQLSHYQQPPLPSHNVGAGKSRPQESASAQKGTFDPSTQR